MNYIKYEKKSTYVILDFKFGTRLIILFNLEIT